MFATKSRGIHELCLVLAIIGCLAVPAQGQYRPPGVPQIQTPPIRIPPPNINIQVSENFRQWQRTREEMAKNASYHTRDVPKGPDPSESSRTFGRGVNGYFIVVMIAAGIGGFILAVHLYMRCRRPLSPEELALTDPWVRAQMQETAAANASARPPEPG